ncbi:MAG: hypothetical protein ACKO1Y_05135 [Actinomycetota bacterium]
MIGEWGSGLLAVLLVSGPALVFAGSRIVGAGDDARYYRWLGWRIGRAIADGRLVPLRLGGVITPTGLDLRLVDGYLPSWIAGALNLDLSPTAAYNFVFVIGAIANLLAARALAVRLGGNRLVRTVTAVAFVSAPALAVNVQQGLPSLWFAFTVPLLVADALAVVAGGRVRPVRLTVLLVVAYLCSVYFLVFGGIAYGVIVGVAAIRARTFRPVGPVLAAVLAATVVLLPLIVPRLQFDREQRAAGVPTELLADSYVFSADALSVVAQPARSTILVPRPDAVARANVRLPDVRGALESTAFPGFVLLVGGIAFLATRDRRRLPLALAIGVTWILGLGPTLRIGGEVVWTRGDAPVAFLPYRALLAFPGLGGLRVPVRTAEILAALLAAATAVALQRRCDAGRPPIGALAAGVTVLLATNLLLPLPTTDDLLTPRSRVALGEVAERARPGDTVLSVPSDCDPSFAALQVVHRTPVVGCAGSFAANPWDRERAYLRVRGFDALRCDRSVYGRLRTDPDAAVPAFDAAAVRSLRDRLGVRFLVVDRERLVGCGVGRDIERGLAGLPSLGGDARFAVIDLGLGEAAPDRADP